MSDQDDVVDRLPERESVEDEAEEDAIVPEVRYDISSYGADLDVEGLVRRLQRGEILIPRFQRGYVWRLPEASRFIESLLLGLPVPGVFFARERDTNKFLVIDGQQRLKTLQFFREGYFNPQPESTRQRVFALQKVQERFENQTFSTLEEPDRIRLESSIIHATIVKQDAPPDNDTSVYHIFERLNSAGRLLAPQEIRAALYHGPLLDALRELNENSDWRLIVGSPQRLKDQELILRFGALLLEPDRYKRPMSEFLNLFAAGHQYAPPEFRDELRQAFVPSIALAARALGPQAFRPVKALNAAVFDSVMVGIASRLRSGRELGEASVRAVYAQLLEDGSYKAWVSRSTADEASVRSRLAASISAFASA